MKFKLLLLSLFVTSPAISFEINTHQAITTCALSNKCLGIEDQQGSQNLNYFALTMILNNVDYSGYAFGKYEPTTYSNHT